MTAHQQRVVQCEILVGLVAELEPVVDDVRRRSQVAEVERSQHRLSLDVDEGVAQHYVVRVLSLADTYLGPVTLSVAGVARHSGDIGLGTGAGIGDVVKHQLEGPLLVAGVDVKLSNQVE